MGYHFRELWRHVLRRLPYGLRITLGADYYRRGWKALYRACVPPPPELQSLVSALQAGNYNGEQGGKLVVEDLSAVMKCVTFDAPWPDPKWYQIWKWASKDYMFLLRFQQRSTSIKLRRNPQP